MGWTHSVCVACWNSQHKDRPAADPEKYVNGHLERCCFCGKGHCSGIYIREDPKSEKLSCKGACDL